MARLPQPGGDNGNWGDILNEYLSQSHKPDGTLKNDSVGPAQLVSGAVTKADIELGNVDNTSDINKPVSTAVQAVLNTKFDTTTMSFTRTAVLPSAFGWPSAHPLTPELTENLKGEMIGSCGYTAEQFFDRFSSARSAPSATYYVNRQSGVGSDSNNGLSFSSPFLTIAKAITTANAGGLPTKIYVEYGEYNRTVSFQDTSPTVDIAFIGTDGNTLGGRAVPAGTWDTVTGFVADTTYTSTYSKTVANCARVIDRLANDNYGNAIDLLQVSSPAICNSNPGTWHCDGSKLYVHRNDNSIPTDSSTRYFRDSVSAVRITQQVNVYFDGFDFQGSGSSHNVMFVNSPATSTPSNLNAIVTKNCVARYGGMAGAAGNGAGKGFAASNWYGYFAHFGSRADANADDGFGIHNLQGGPAYMLTVNCSARDNGRLHTSVNAFTLHENCLGVDIAGKFELSRGGTVHNIDNSKAYLLGTIAGNDLGDANAGGGIPPVSIRATTTAEIWAERVTAYNPPGRFCYQAIGSAKIHRRNCTPSVRADSGDGTFDTF